MKRSLHYYSSFMLVLSLLLVFFLPSDILAQPTVIGTQLVNGGYSTTNLTLRGGARFVRLQATSTGSGRNWEFASGTASSTDYSTNWRPYTSGQTLSGFNTYIDPATAPASARYNTGFGGQSGLLPTITSGNYYTFNVGINNTSNNFMSLLETTYNPISISSATQNPAASSVYNGQNVTVTLNTTASLNSGEFAYLRYTTDGFATSTIVPFSMSGSTGTATISSGVNTTGTNVVYYVFTSNQSSIATPSQADYFTLNLLNISGQNVSGSNFSYTVQATPLAPSFVVHQQSTATVVNPCAGSSTYWNANPTIGSNLVLQWNIENGSEYTGSNIYYTTDGSTPSGSRGTALGTSTSVASSFVCNAGVKNIVTGTIPASANLEGKTIKYIIGAWFGLTGTEGFATTSFSFRNTTPFVYSYSLPGITLSGANLSAFTACSGLVSAEQNFTVTSVNLTGNLVVTAPTGFEVSKTTATGFAGSISLTPAEAASATLYVRMNNAAVGTPSGNITCVSSGLTKNKAVSGTVNALPTVTAGNVSGCAGSAIALVGSPAGGTFSVANPYTGPSTTYTYSYTDGNGCSATSASATITTFANPTVTAGNVSGCAGTAIALVGSPAGGTFSVANPYTGPSTTYTYSYTDGNG